MRALLLLAVPVSVAAFAAGCGGAEGVAGNAAGIVPADVPVFISVDSDPDSSQWQTVNDLASKFPDKQKLVEEIKKDIREDGLSWDEDIKPALGPELDLVMLDFRNDGENVVGLMQPDDEDAFERAVKKANASEDDPEDRMVYGKVGGWTVISDKQSLIDRFRQMSENRKRSLEDDDAFNAAMDSGDDDSLAKAYVNGRIAMDEIVKATDPQFRSFVLRLGKLDWLGTTVAAKDDGVAFDMTVHGTPGKLFAGANRAREFKAKLPERVPKDAVLFLTFHGTKGMLGGLEKNPLFQSPEVRPALNVFRKITTLLEGENAFYVRPGQSGKLPEITFVTEPRKGTSGRATLDRIVNRFLTPELGVPPRHRMIAGAPATSLAFGPFGIHYADVGDNLVVTDLAGGIAAFKNGGTPLADQDTYRDALDSAGVPDKTHGFFYVDVRRGTGLAERLAGAPIPDEIRRNLKPLRSAVEYAVSQSHQFSVRAFVRIK